MTNASSKGMFNASVAYGPSMVLIACSGPATVVEICSALSFGGEIARRARRPWFLFDLLAVEFDGTPQDREEIGRVAAGFLRGVDRIAVVLTAATNTGDGERTARQCGLDVRNFETLTGAIGWLTGLAQGETGAAAP